MKPGLHTDLELLTTVTLNGDTWEVSLTQMEALELSERLQAAAIKASKMNEIAPTKCELVDMLEKVYKEFGRNDPGLPSGLDELLRRAGRIEPKP